MNADRQPSQEEADRLLLLRADSLLHDYIVTIETSSRARLYAGHKLRADIAARLSQGETK